MVKVARSFGVLVVAGLVGAGTAFAGPFSFSVANDLYTGVPNGIPTARFNNDGIPDIYNAVNQLLGTAFTGNGDVDPFFMEPDEVWINLTGDVALIGLTAANTNTLGVYSGIGTGAGKTPIIGPYFGFGFLGTGTFADPFPAAHANLPQNTPFGWYLQSDAGAGTSFFYSQAALNVDDCVPGTGCLDHMMTFHLTPLAGRSVWVYTDTDLDGDVDPGEAASRRLYTFSDPFLIAWEDLNYRTNVGTLGDDDYDDMIYLVDRVPDRVPEPGSLFLMGAGLSLLFGLGRRRARKTQFD